MKKEIYEEKEIFPVEGDERKVRMHFRDNITAFHGVKRATFPGKGEINCAICAWVFKTLEGAGIQTHLLDKESATDLVCQQTEAIPLQIIVRNCISGSTSTLLGMADMTECENTIFEMRLKEPDLYTPLINEHHAVALKHITYDEAKEIFATAEKVNSLLTDLFRKAGIRLIDFRLEFGRTPEGKLLIVDEITPDNARLQDIATGERLDKGRFWHDMGNVSDHYQVVLNRLTALNK